MNNSFPVNMSTDKDEKTFRKLQGLGYDPKTGKTKHDKVVCAKRNCRQLDGTLSRKGVSIFGDLGGMSLSSSVTGSLKKWVAQGHY